MRDKAAEQKKHERSFGTIGFVFFLALAGLAFWREHETAAYVFGGLSAFFFFVRFLACSLLHRVYVAWMAVVGVIGRINTYILLSAIFFLVFTPVGVLMRLFGGDRMKRRYEPGADTYWEKVAGKPSDRKRYEQRF